MFNPARSKAEGGIPRINLSYYEILPVASSFFRKEYTYNEL